MEIDRLYPEPARVSVDEDLRGLRLAEHAPDGRPYLVLNMIESLDGRTTVNGTVRELTSPIDQARLFGLRARADAVLVGAGTVRAERYVLPRRTPLAVATSSGDLEGHRFDPDAAQGRLLVLCPPEARDRAVATLDGVPAEIVTVPLGAAADGRMSGDVVVDALRGRGLTHVVCEGGPALAASLVSAGRVDELCLTTSPELATPLTPLVPAGSGIHAPMRLDQLLVDDDHRTYARWAMRRG